MTAPKLSHKARTVIMHWGLEEKVPHPAGIVWFTGTAEQVIDRFGLHRYRLVCSLPGDQDLPEITTK